MDAGDLLRHARLAAGLTQAELAQLGGTSQATLSAYERGSKMPSASTLARVVAAAGMRLTASPASRPVLTPAAVELERRGHILAQVLELAERLPARHAATLQFPRLRSLRGPGA
ncbi:MAG: helix-turn-helix transcriptional regulator [bacterium]